MYFTDVYNGSKNYQQNGELNAIFRVIYSIVEEMKISKVPNELFVGKNILLMFKH